MSEKTQKATAEILALPATVGGSTLAQIFGVSDSYVSKMAERNIIPKTGRGEYPFVACLQAYITYLDKGETEEDGEKTNFNAEKTRLTKAQADKAELELAISRGEFIEVRQVSDTWNKILRELNAQLMNLPAKIGPLAVAVKTPKEGFDLTMGFVKQLLKELSETDVIAAPDGDASET